MCGISYYNFKIFDSVFLFVSMIFFFQFYGDQAVLGESPYITNTSDSEIIVSNNSIAQSHFLSILEYVKTGRKRLYTK